MDYFENVNIGGKYLRRAFEYLSTIHKCQIRTCFFGGRIILYKNKLKIKRRNFIESTFFKNTICDWRLMVKKVVVFMK
jgi:hypothetical protein